jgi:hypothetical protein
MATKKTGILSALKPVLDLQELARRVGPVGSVWVKTGLNFDHPEIDVASITVIITGPGGTRSLTVQSYDGSVGKAAARLESLETAGTPIKGEVVEYMSRLERRGYRVVAVADDAEAAAKKARRGRKAAEAAEPVASRRGRRKAD